MNDLHVTDLLGAYALGCLDPEEKEQVARHLASCSLCQAELRTYQSVVDDLPLVVPQKTPPALLKKAVLQRAAASSTPAVQIGLLERLRGLFRSIQPAWGVISLVLILGLAVSNILLWQQIQQRASQQITDFRTVSLKSPEASSQAIAMLVISDGGNFGTLVVDGLPPLTAGKQYQLWLIKNGQRTSGGMFSVNNAGYGALVVNSTASLLSYDSFGVTIEPGGGSPAPTGPKVLGGSF